MRIFLSPPIRLLLLAGMTGVCSRGWAQFDPVVPTLSPAATTTISTTPVTTLSTDLLTAPRPFVFDETGANILATEITPEVDASERNSAVSETDTALRDSAQTGHANPYAREASRLGLSFAVGSAPSSRRLSSSNQPGASLGSDSGVHSSAADAQNDDRSTWGTGSAFASHFDGRSRSGTTGSTDSLSPEASQLPDQPDSAATEIPSPLDSGDSTISSRTRLTASTRDRPSSATRQPKSLTAPATANSTRSAIRAQGSQAGRAGKDPNDQGGRAQDSLSLSLFSRPSTEFTFGASPFSAPGGNGELTFLNPDILKPPSSYGGTFPGQANRHAGATQTGLRPSERSRTLQTNANGYGLATRPRGLDSSRRSSEGRKHRNPYLESNPPDLLR